MLIALLQCVFVYCISSSPPRPRVWLTLAILIPPLSHLFFPLASSSSSFPFASSPQVVLSFTVSSVSLPMDSGAGYSLNCRYHPPPWMCQSVIALVTGHSLPILSLLLRVRFVTLRPPHSPSISGSLPISLHTVPRRGWSRERRLCHRVCRWFRSECASLVASALHHRL